MTKDLILIPDLHIDELYQNKNMPYGKDIVYIDENYLPCEKSTAILKQIWNQDGTSYFIPIEDE